MLKNGYLARMQIPIQLHSNIVKKNLRQLYKHISLSPMALGPVSFTTREYSHCRENRFPKISPKNIPNDIVHIANMNHCATCVALLMGLCTIVAQMTIV